MRSRFVDVLRQPLARLDSALNRLLGWRYNPLYHSGVLAASLLAIVTVTGVYLLFFYRIGSPWASVARITDDIFLGSFTRSLHRYASDAAVLAVAVHALRLFLQRRAWGARALAWLSGLFLLFLLMASGWTGYVMVWDIQGEVLAREGARWMDVLPLFSEPISRAFDGARPMPGAFFFLNLFLHIALPIGLGLLFWIHVVRVARPHLVPPRGLLWGVTGLLSAASILVPVGMEPQADLLLLPGPAEYDVFFSFFLPLTQPLEPWAVWGVIAVVSVALLLVPSLTQPAPERLPVPSSVDERRCTGCEQCYLDCPYEAISMVGRADGRTGLVARVSASLCTSCGICAGSCAPMGVGPPGRTGREQLRDAQDFASDENLAWGDVVLIACGRSAAAFARPRDSAPVRPRDSAPVHIVNCAGAVHTSVVEYFVRSGAGGVLIVSCPPRDCWNREGPVWLEQRLYHDREAELQQRVDRRRVRLVFASEAEHSVVTEELERFRGEVRALEAAAGEQVADLERACEPEVTSGGVAP